jgi:long-chain acyl-CoA synthetase
MPSALDMRIRESTARLTGAGGPMALSMIEVNGVSLPMIAAAPSTLGQYFEYFCTQHGDAEFIIDGDERLSFKAVLTSAQNVARALVGQHGVTRGDRVGIAARNASSWVVLYMGIVMAGGVATLFNGWWQGGELADGIEEVGCGLVFVDPPRAKRLAESGRTLAARIITLDVARPLADALAPVLGAGGGGIPLPELTGEDIATILFTSGSTGKSKGAWSNHRAVVQGTFNYLCQALTALEIAVSDGIPLPAQQAILLSVPLFHVTGEVPMLLMSYAIGRKIVLMPKWDAERAMQLIEAEKITNFTGVPLMSYEIMSHPNRARYDLSSLQTMVAGGAPRPPEHVRRMADALPTAPPALGYGLTETNGIGCSIFMQNYLDKPNSTGPATPPLVDLAILDDAGNSLPNGSKGEVCIRSIANFSGYWNRPEATAECMTLDGYFRSGDIGYLDADGYLFIVDRKKDIIIRGGENISCQEVEAAFYENPHVAEACVFGLPDEKFGEVPGAVVYLRTGATATEVGLQEDMRARIAAFNIPERIWISDAPLPRLGTEKIDKRSLRRTYQAIWAARG